MGILSWAIFGLVAGVLAKWIMPGKDPGRIIVTILLGVAGAIVGGFIGTQIGFGDVSGFNIRSFLLAVGGAALLLAGYTEWRNEVTRNKTWLTIRAAASAFTNRTALRRSIGMSMLRMAHRHG